MVEGRGDLDAASSARCRPARAPSRSFAFDVAGPGVAGAAGRDAACRPPRRDASDRHSRHDHAMAPRHRAPPVGACVASPLWPSAGAPQRACGLWCCGWRGRTSPGANGGSTASLPDWASRSRRPRSGKSSRALGSIRRPAGTARAGRSSCGPRRRGSWRWTSSPPTCSTEPGSMSWPSSSTAPAASGSLAPPSTPSRPGSCNRPGTCSWTWKMPGRG